MIVSLQTDALDDFVTTNNLVYGNVNVISACIVLQYFIEYAFFRKCLDLSTIPIMHLTNAS